MYSKHNPYYAILKRREPLCGAGSHKNTFHVELDLTGSGIEYQVGDSVAILPQHDKALVERTLSAMEATGDEKVLSRDGAPFLFRTFLTTHANITTTNRKLWTEIAGRLESGSEAEKLLTSENRPKLKELMESLHLWEVLEKFSEVKLSPQELCSLLTPLLPRFYSIASSQKAFRDEMHLTVALVAQEDGKKRGVCTHYLYDVVPQGERAVPLYIQPHKGFTLPSDPNSNLIMVGPGTGIAPFRAMMQERVSRGDSGQSWLFFGECNRNLHFFYEEEWLKWEEEGKLRLDLAFSRDQEHKVYVQDRLREQSKELFQWIDSGAYFMVCGDAKRMAKDVEAALKEIIRTEGKMAPDAAQAYIRQMRKEGRYLRDVY